MSEALYVVGTIVTQDGIEAGIIGYEVSGASCPLWMLLLIK